MGLIGIFRLARLAVKQTETFGSRICTAWALGGEIGSFVWWLLRGNKHCFGPLYLVTRPTLKLWRPYLCSVGVQEDGDDAPVSDS